MRSKVFSFLIFPAIILLVGFKVLSPGRSSSKHKHKTSSRITYADTVVTNFFKRDSGWIASDGALTIPLSDGKSMWLMGDSHINDYDVKTATVPCLFQVRNCVLLQPGNDWQWQHTQTFIGKGPGTKSYFKFDPGDRYFSWPGAGVQIGDTVYVYCSNLKNKSGGGAFGFEKGGNDYVAKIKYPGMKVSAYTQLPAHNDIGFDFSMIKNDNDGYVYVYGSKLKLIAGELYVARFPVNNPNAPWMYWDGNNWNPDPAKSKVILESPSTSVSICKVKNKYIMLCTQFSVGCDQGKDIYSAISDSPLGPFNKPKVIYSIPDRKNGHSPFFYSVFGHPEYINTDNELLVTYSINGYGNCTTDCINGRNDPNVYRPRGIRVPLKLIDPAL